MTISRHLWHLSAVAYALSWCVPVTVGRGELLGGNFWGWQALLFAISPLLGNNAVDAGWFAQIVMVASAFTNVLYLGFMVFAYLRPGAERRVGGRALVAASLVNASWPVLFDTGGDLRLGYYLWVAAFPLGAASLLLGGAAAPARRTEP